MRDDQVRARLRGALHQILVDALDRAGISVSQCMMTSTGDGLLVLVDPLVSKAAVVRALLDHMSIGIAEHNRLSAEVARLQVRAVVHAGELVLDDQGAAGEQINLAFRVLDSEPLRT